MRKKLKNWYILLEKFLERDIWKNEKIDISSLRNFSSKIYQKWDWLIYFAREISWARYIKNGIGWYILLEKFLKQDITKIDLGHISWLQSQYIGFKYDKKLGAKWQAHNSVTKWNKEAQLCNEIEWLTSVFISISSSKSYFQHFPLQSRYINQILFQYTLLK